MIEAVAQKIRISKLFRPLYETDGSTRYVLVTGGRASAKSFTVGHWACIESYIEDQVILFTRYTMSSGQMSIKPEFEDKIDRLNVGSHFTINNTSVINKRSGTTVLFRGIKTGSGNQTANMKSIAKMNILIVDEAEEFIDEKVFNTIDMSIRRDDAKNLIVLIMNPTTVDHWIYKRWFDGHLKFIEIDGEQIGVSNHPDIIHIHTTYLNNLDNISESYLQRIRKIKKENYKRYVHEILGGWLERADGVIYENWEVGNFDHSLPYVFGLDYGVNPDPAAMVRVAVDYRLKRLYVKEEMYQTNLSSEQLKINISKAATRRDLIVSDTNESRTNIDLSKAGFNIVKTKKNVVDSVKNGIAKIQDYTIVVEPSSQSVIRELNNYQWNNKKSSTPIKANDHAMDAMRYAFMRLTAKRRKGLSQGNRPI